MKGRILPFTPYTLHFTAYRQFPYGKGLLDSKCRKPCKLASTMSPDTPLVESINSRPRFGHTLPGTKNEQLRWRRRGRTVASERTIGLSDLSQ